MCEILKFNTSRDDLDFSDGPNETNEDTTGPSIHESVTDAEFEDLMTSMMNDIKDIGSDRFQFLQELKTSREADKVKRVSTGMILTRF